MRFVFLLALISKRVLHMFFFSGRDLIHAGLSILVYSPFEMDDRYILGHAWKSGKNAAMWLFAPHEGNVLRVRFLWQGWKRIGVVCEWYVIIKWKVAPIE